MKVLVKQLNGDLFEIDVENVENVEHIKSAIQRIDPLLFRKKYQKLTHIEDNLYFLLMDYSLENEDHYGCIIESYGYNKQDRDYEKHTIEFYGKGLIDFIGKNEETDIVFFEYNKKTNLYKDDHNTYSSLSDLILSLPPSMRIPRSEIALERIKRRWNNGDYYFFDLSSDDESSDDDNDGKEDNDKSPYEEDEEYEEYGEDDE